MSITLRRPNHQSPRTQGMSFCPPLPNRLLQETVKKILPFVFQKPLGQLSVQVDEASLAYLQNIRGERCLLLPNHPAQWDPWVMYALGTKLNEFFYYVVAREVFDWHYGLQGWFLQRVGSYSVVRGASDKESFKTTKEILAQNKGRLVIFVEGEISNQNDSLLPLEPGVIQLGFLALQELYKQAGKNKKQLPSLFVCPVSIKYFYAHAGLEKTIEKSIQALEKALGIPHPAKLHPYEQIRAIGLTVLQETAKQFGYPLSYDDSLYQQIKGLENFMLTKMEQVVNLPYEPELSYLDRVRRIRNTVNRVLKEVPEESLTVYQKRLHEHQKAVLENFYWDLDRIVNFIAIYDGYISENMALERYVEVIRRLEREVFGDYHLQHPRVAVVKVLKPIDLKDHFEAFLQDKKKVVEELAQAIEQDLYQGITSAKVCTSKPF